MGANGVHADAKRECAKSWRGDRVIVRGEVTGTPAGDLFGVPHTGKSFRIMAIDIQTIQDGKIARTYHIENWLSALGQLRAK
jgi:predicted ester cyclase